MYISSILKDTPPSNISIPFVVEKSSTGERTYDLASRMLEDRVIVIDSGFDDHMAHVLKLELLYLDSVSAEPITIYIGSPGGSVTAGLGIADVVKNMRAPIRVINSGMCASMGAYFLTVLGTPGMRLMGERSFTMIHQVSSGTSGLILDQEISLNFSKRLNKLLTEEIAAAVGVSHEQLLKDADRDLWLSAEESLNYGDIGVCDGILVGQRNEDGKFKVKRRDGSFEWI